MNIFRKKPFVIGDIGVSISRIAEKEEMSNMDVIKFIIDEAKSCGVDAVNIPSYKLENIISSKASSYLDSFDDFNNCEFDLFKEFDSFSREDYMQLAEFCRSIGIMFLATPYDFESVDCLGDFVDVYEISASDLTNIPFIKYVASKNKPILLSTGAATLREIREAVNAIEEVSTVDIALMHEVLSYPTEYDDANLLMIKDLVNNFPVYEVGYIDYTEPDDDMMVLTAAYNYGAVIIEKHFTLDKSLNDGYDYAMDADDVIKFRNNVFFLSKVNGYSNKQPLICESLVRKELRKSIVAKRDIEKGQTISMSDIAFKRPGIGISPADVDEVIGKTAVECISKDTLIDFQMLNKKRN